MKNKTFKKRLKDTRGVQRMACDARVQNKETLESAESEDEIINAAALASAKDSIDNHAARSLSESLRILADCFWYDSPAKFQDIRLQKDLLRLSATLPFQEPPASGEPGDFLATQKDVRRIRNGFVTFLKRRPQLAKRIVNLFYSEFFEFLMTDTKVYRFSDEIRKKVDRPVERRMAGRPVVRIPPARREVVLKVVTEIYEAALTMQKTIKDLQRKEPGVSDDHILEQLRHLYDREEHPWSRYAFQNAKNLPAKRSYKTERRADKPERTSASIGEPERWSAPGAATSWTQIWFYREYGVKYSLKAIKALLEPTLGTDVR